MLFFPTGSRAFVKLVPNSVPLNTCYLVRTRWNGELDDSSFIDSPHTIQDALEFIQ